MIEGPRFPEKEELSLETGEEITPEEIATEVSIQGFLKHMKALEELKETENYRELGMAVGGAMLMATTLFEMHFDKNMVGFDTPIYFLGLLAMKPAITAGFEKLAEQYRFIKERVKIIWEN